MKCGRNSLDHVFSCSKAEIGHILRKLLHWPKFSQDVTISSWFTIYSEISCKICGIAETQLFLGYPVYWFTEYRKKEDNQPPCDPIVDLL